MRLKVLFLFVLIFAFGMFCAPGVSAGENGSQDFIYAEKTEGAVRLTNMPDGYSVEVPQGAEFDYSRSEYITKVYGDNYSFTISREYCPYNDYDQAMTDALAGIYPDFKYENHVEQYIMYYENRFLLSEEWRKNNDVTLLGVERRKIGGNNAVVIRAVIENLWENFNEYCYCYVRVGNTNSYLRFLVKYRYEDREFKAQLENTLNSIQLTETKGSAGINVKYGPVLPSNWSKETRKLYDTIAGSNEMSWGIYTEDIAGSGINEKIPKMESQLGYKFDYILAYLPLGYYKDPEGARAYMESTMTEFIKRCWSEQRILELTFQYTDNNNENLSMKSPLLEMYRTGDNEIVRRFAKAAKKFGHPFIFRLNNEMNSDWTSYGGVVNMGDPDIFIKAWRDIYRIFREEGANNCIWVFNPNDREAPPCRWNNSLMYYPGNNYVHMIGVTGYNNGTYYAEKMEKWREFEEIYDNIEEEYSEIYGAFPWIITEFASSSIGGSKEAWIDNMFGALKNSNKYDNIKLAFWFSFADFDENGNAARPYWLDETEGTLEAFKRGLGG